MCKTFVNKKLLFLIFLVITTINLNALANPIIPIPTQPQPLNFTAGIPNLDATGYILLDATSGKVLAQKNADNRMAPASLTKLMSLYVISSAIKNGQIRLDDKVRISNKAWKTE